MRCKQLALRVLSTAAVLTIVSSVAAPAFAEAAGIAAYGTYYVDKGSVTVTGDSVHYVDETGEHDVEHDDDIIITGTTDKNTVTIKSDEGQNTKVTLKDVKIDVGNTGKVNSWTDVVAGDAALSVTGDGDTTIKLQGENELISGAGRAGLEKNDSDSNGKLTITADNEDASLKANGGEQSAGIGGKRFEGSSQIIIEGGTINALGRNNGAGIGGGNEGNGEVTINGGDVTATGGSRASGIGGGRRAEGKVTINDGKVTASTWGYGSAIGGGFGEEGAGDVTITGGEVETVWTTGNPTTGIGGSAESTKKSTVRITGGTVNALGTGNAAGIGGGTGDNQVADVEISGNANITAKSAGKTENTVGTGAAIGTAGTADGIIGQEADLDLSSSTGTVIRDTASTAADHSHEWTLDSHIDAGIDQLGETVYKCTGCDATRTDYEPITGHNWNAGEITTEPTCTEAGVRTYTCTGCGASKTEAVEALGHAFGEWVPDGEGHKTRTCARCSEKETVADDSNIAAAVTGADSSVSGAAARISYKPLTVEGAPAYEQTVANGRVVIAVPAQSASLTGSLHALKELEAEGAEVLVFRTQLCESTVAIDEMLALGGEADVFALTHTEGAAALTVGAADHSDLLK